YTDFLFRWMHIAFGILWIGLLYYFNFVQTEYFKEAEADARKDALQKLAPRALFYFRWAAALTFLTGAVLLVFIAHKSGGFQLGNLSLDITLGALMGTIMMLNVWLIIWPNQRKVIAGAADAAQAAPKAAIASRTNTLLSLPMLYFMVSSAHQTQGSLFAYNSVDGIAGVSTVALLATLAIITLLEANAIWMRKMGPMASVAGVIHSSIGLTVVMALAVNYL
ncbi:MAG: urate hydroxylase PuuD, partial [Gammaproteobacteria bacterium]